MKKLLRVHQSSASHWVGNGFPVRSVFDYNGLGRELSPFLLLDYAEPYEFPPGNEMRGVGGHQHKGFETVTLVYEGELEHRDSTGGGGKIGPGDVQWMTAGSKAPNCLPIMPGWNYTVRLHRPSSRNSEWHVEISGGAACTVTVMK